MSVRATILKNTHSIIHLVWLWMSPATKLDFSDISVLCCVKSPTSKVTFLYKIWDNRFTCVWFEESPKCIMHETMQSKQGELGCDQVWFYIFMSNCYHRQLLLYYLSFSNVQDINVALIVMSQVNKRFLPILVSCITL